jgi:hypothetical protein
MKRFSPGPKTPSTLSEPFHQALNLYALAASAAGVSVLALVQPSEAEIVYTPTHQIIGCKDAYGIDLNQDGVTDFTIQNRCGVRNIGFGYFWFSDFLKAIPTSGNRVLLSSEGFAAALVAGAKIGSGHSQSAASRAAVMARTFGYNNESQPYYSGAWIGASNRYLGFQFQINGETHYGWARLTMKWNRGKHLFTAGLTGFAYETEAHKAILAGQTEEDSAAEAGKESSNRKPHAPGQSTLGSLALGSAGISLWRGKESVEMPLVDSSN